MTRFATTESDSALTAFDPTSPIGYALAQEFLATPDERAQAVVLRLEMTPTGPATPIDWFAPAEPADDVIAEVEILKAS